MNTTTKPTKLSTVRCGLGHGGNHTLHLTVGGAWECAGCGAIYTSAQIAAPTKAPLGFGGVISAAK